MGDISMRGKGRALKMKEGGKASKDFMGLAPKDKARRRKRADGAMKRRAEEASMRELRYPTSKPKRRRPEREPDRGPFKPMPMPMPRPDRPNMKPMPDRRPKLPKDIEKYFMKTPRRVIPLKDGGSAKALADLFGKGVTGTLAKIPPSTLKTAFEKAKKLKPSGRLNVDDLKKAIDSMKKAKKIDMNPARRKAETGSYTGKTRAEKLAQSIKDRPMRQKLRRKTRKII